MKKKILLIDESLTVQKVVALTLDKSKYQLTFAKTKAEVTKILLDNPPDLVMLSDQVSEFNAANFPKEMETWIGGVREAAPVILITGQDVKEQRHYAGVLRKPFSPQALQALVLELVKSREAFQDNEAAEEIEDERLQKIFNDTFADESTLVRETFRAEVEAEEPTKVSHIRPKKSDSSGTSLWEVTAQTTKNSSEDAEMWKSQPTERASKIADQLFSEGDVEKYISTHKLDEIVDKVLSRVVPPIVEKLVNERLDRLLKEQADLLELK